MPKSKLKPLTSLFLTLLLLQTHLTICNGVSVLGLDSLGNEVMATRVSRKSIGECFEEAEMDSEINRRVLVMQKKYISYETLKRDIVPCTKPGASYYNCQARQANPYNRGCEVITGCARNVKN